MHPIARWQIVSAAPHRMFFMIGWANALLAMGWWGMQLVLRFLTSTTSINTRFAHEGHLIWMLFLLFTPFFFGFLLTAGPRWLGVNGPPRPLYLSQALGLAMASVCCLIGLQAGFWMVQLGLGIWCVTAGSAALWYGRCIRQSTAKSKWHAIGVVYALVMGVVAAGCALLATSSGGLVSLWEVETLAIWCFLLPIFLTVVHRMVPFFTANVMPMLMPWRPDWLLGAWIGLAALHAILSILGHPNFCWFADLPLAGLATYTVYRWKGWKTCQTPILVMLHIAFVWFPIAMWLYTIQSMGLLADLAWMGLTPLHALTVGLMGSLVLAMVTRVTLGHSGHPLVASLITWRLFLGYQLVVFSRLLAEWQTSHYVMWLLIAVVGWLVVFAGWGTQHVGIYWRPRADGAEG